MNQTERAILELIREALKQKRIHRSALEFIAEQIETGVYLRPAKKPVLALVSNS